MIFAVPNTTFGNLWWLGLRVNKFYWWDYHSCSWPGDYELHHRGALQIATSMRIFSYDRWSNGSSWTQQLEALAAEDVSSLHLTWWTKRTELRQPAEVLRFVLDRAVRLAGGAAALSTAQRTCVRGARAWLDRIYPKLSL